MIVVLAGSIGFGYGALFGVVAGFRSAGKFPTFGHTLLVFFGLGSIAGGIATKSSEGVALFLVFGLVGAALPMLIGYFTFQFAVKYLRNLNSLSRRKSRAEA